MTAIAEPVPGTGSAGGAGEVHPLLAGHLAAEGEIENPHDRLKVYVWPSLVRITHWVTAICIVTLSLTGGYIADPFLIPPKGSVMTTVRLVHIITAFVFLASGLIRTYYLIRGNHFVRWTAFIPVRWIQVTEFFRQAGFYAYVRKEIPKVIGHNQLAASAYLVLFALLLVETVTGFALDGLLGTEPGATAFDWVRQIFGVQLVRLVHHAAMWGILAIAFLHVYSCVIVDNLEKSGVLSSIFTGYKYPTREEIVESRDGGPEVLAEAEASEWSE